MFKENRQISFDLSKPGAVESAILGAPGAIGPHDKYTQAALDKPDGVIRSMLSDTRNLAMSALTAPIAIARPPARFIAGTVENAGHLADRVVQVPTTAAITVASIPGVVLAKAGKILAKTPSTVTGFVAKGLRKLFRLAPKD